MGVSRCVQQLSCALVVALLTGCGGSSATPTTPTTATPCVQTMLLEGNASLPAHTADVESVTTTTTGRLDVTFDWTSPSSTMLVAVAKDPCSFDQWQAGSCKVLLNSSSPPKPLKGSVQSVAAGTYVLFFGNTTSVVESAAVQVVLSSGSCPAVSSLTTQTTDQRLLPNEIHGGRSGLLRP
jgi:hypothetical protein